MFARLFQRAEATVDNAIGDLFNRLIIAVFFLIALAFATASLAITLNNAYGPELGNLLVAGIFCVLGIIAALILRPRTSSKAIESAADETLKAEAENEISPAGSIFDDETVMAVVSSAAPVIVPAMIRTGLKNWPLLLSIAAGLYVMSRPTEPTAGIRTSSAQP
jgi:hypothetical protein